MDLQPLETLEERVNKAVEIIAALKADKKKLENENKALHGELDKLSASMKSAQATGEELAALQAENQRLAGAHAEIKKRLGDVISKLEKFKD
ncbi:MAG TPA: cell division protein ZapB [Candidatus Edwardsbacteria bacterium]|nr:cell division protein ZapB [Candidatus Edwardsbacteria bacterium]